MRIINRVFCCAAALAALAAPVAPVAASADDSTAAGVSVGTFGLGVQVEKPLQDGRAGLRVVTGNYTLNANSSSSGVNYNAQAKLSNVAVLGELHPNAGAFRISAGYVFGGSQITATGVPSGQTFTINGQTYNNTQLTQLDGAIKLGSAPVLMIGWGGGKARKGGMQFTADLGAAFYSPSTSLTPTYGANANDPNVGINNPNSQTYAQFQSNLAQAQADFQNSVGALRTYPVLSLGVATRF